MKDIVIVPRVDVFSYVGKLWQSDEFKAAHNESGSFVHHMVLKLSKYPRSFFSPTEEIEHGHFTTWMGFISMRNHYTNPYIHDLYLFHEMTHLSTMPYFGHTTDFNTWYLKMQENELFSALASEVFIYFFMAKEGRPIRDKTFQHPIWADRFLSEYQDDYSGYNLDNYLRWFNNIVSARRTVMHGFGVNPNATPANQSEWVEYQVSRFAKQNYEWALVWKDHYRFVENGMAEMMFLCDTASLRAHMDDKTVFQRYIDAWLMPNSTNSIYFRDLAVKFDNMFKSNNAVFGNLMTE